jgi:hypothetical protein
MLVAIRGEGREGGMDPDHRSSSELASELVEARSEQLMPMTASCHLDLSSGVGSSPVDITGSRR